VIPFEIIDYCYGRHPLNFGVGDTQNGRMAAILDVCYNIMAYYLSSSTFARWCLSCRDGSDQGPLSSAPEVIIHEVLSQMTMTW